MHTESAAAMAQCSARRWLQLVDGLSRTRHVAQKLFGMRGQAFPAGETEKLPRTRANKLHSE